MDRHPLTEAVEAGSADSLLASTLYLMTRYAADPCPRRADLVDRHLAAVASHRVCWTLVRETARRAATDWRTTRPGCPLGFDRPPCG